MSLLSFFTYTLLPSTATSQSISLELTGGHTYFQNRITVNAAYSEHVRLFMVNIYNAFYEERAVVDMVNITQIVVPVWGSLNLAAGANFNTATNFTPVVGINYVRNEPDYSLVLAPVVGLSQNVSGEFYGQINWTPFLNDKLRGLLSLSVLHTFRFPYEHQVSFEKLKIGLTYQGYSAGIGAIFDQLGPSPTQEYNVGLFLDKVF